MTKTPHNIRQNVSTASADSVDRVILLALQQNARITNKELAARIGLSQSSTLARVRRLERTGVLTGYHAEVDPRVYGITLEAQVSVRLEKHVRSAIAAFEHHLSHLPEVRGWYHLGGSNDYLVHVAVRDAEHLREFVLASFASRPEVAHLETALVFSSSRNVAYGER